jgi:hypothetical protein
MEFVGFSQAGTYCVIKSEIEILIVFLTKNIICEARPRPFGR